MSGATREINLQGNWMRATVANKVCITEALRDLLHTECGLTKNKKQIHSLLTNFKQREKKNLKKIIHKKQWDLLCHVCSKKCIQPCPKHGVTELEDFDITNLSIIFRNIGKIIQGLDEQIIQQLMDAFLEYVNEASDIRNYLMHSSSKGMTMNVFNDQWTKIKNLLVGLKYQNMKLFTDLETCSLDPYLSQQIDIIKTLYNNLDSKKCDRIEHMKLKATFSRLETKVCLLYTSPSPRDS